MPRQLLFMESLPGKGLCRLLDEKGGEHLIRDGVLESHYRLMVVSKSDALVEKYWAKEKPAPQQPYVSEKSAVESKAAPAAKKAAPKASAEKAAPAKKTTKKVAKKSSEAEPAAAGAKKKSTKKVAKKTSKKAAEPKSADAAGAKKKTTKKAAKKVSKKKA